MNALYTGPSPEDLDRIPDALKAPPQWVLWRGADRIDQQTGEVKLNKIPIDPQTLRNADTTDPETWRTFQQCVVALPVALEEWEQEDPTAYRGGGIGYVFTSDDPYTGVDLDHCRDPETGVIADWAQGHIDALASYTEVTPSRTGVHILGQGALPPKGRRKGAVEMYDYARFFTMTGWHIEARQEALTAFHSTIFGAPQPTHQHGPTPQGSSTPLLDDTILLDKARAAMNGAKFTALWSGDFTEYGSQSEADLALCIRLAFWTQDSPQIDRLFRQSGLMRDKWDAKRGAQTYGERTMAEALARQTEHYTPLKDAHQRRHGSDASPEVAQAQDDTKLPYSDVYNARRLVQAHGKDLHYCYPWGKWLTWTGTHWKTEDTGESMRRAKATAVAMVQDAQQWLTRVVHKLAQAALGNEGEPLDLLNMTETDAAPLQAAKKEQKAATRYLEHAASTLQDRRLKAMLAQAQDEPSIPVLPQDLDRDPWLLNCLNGTLDLRTGELRSHQRGDLLTQGIAVAYVPDAQCPTWNAFLDHIMAGNQDLIGFLQRAVGYALTGVIREHVLPILWGKGSNGKSTFLNTLRAMFGPYAMKAAGELLLVSTNDRHPTERADLFGKRFVFAIETEKGRRLAEVFVKEATGGDPIRARRMREDFWEFWPTHKVFLGTNHKPVITGTDHAIWRRIRLVPFTVIIPDEKQDLTLPDKLEAELSGILAWAVRGCLDWQKDGLGEPDEVQQATAGYRAEMDTVGGFIAECCFTGSNYRAKADELYDAYKLWCERNRASDEGQRAFGNALTEKEFERKKSNGINWWLGIALQHTEQQSTPGGRERFEV